MATVYLSENLRHEFGRLFTEWQRSGGAKFFFMPPQGRAPDNRLAYTMVPDEFVELLRRRKIPFSLPSK
jgi:hypothetical protein